MIDETQAAKSAKPELSPNRAAWTDTGPYPWRRFLARTIDNIVVGALTLGMVEALWDSAFPGPPSPVFGMLDGSLRKLFDGFLAIAAALPINAMTIGLTGGSIGKWIFGVRVLKDGRPIGVVRAARRELEVWVFGLGLGLPIVSLITLVNAEKDLRSDGETPWDAAQELMVTYRLESLPATLAMWLIGLALGALTIWGLIAPFASSLGDT